MEFGDNRRSSAASSERFSKSRLNSLGESTDVSFVNSEAAQVCSNHADVIATLLMHKVYVEEIHPNPPTIDGFPPIRMLDCASCQKAIGYREKKIPYSMRIEGDNDCSISRSGSVRSVCSRAQSRRSMNNQGGVNRDVSSRSMRGGNLLPGGDLPLDGSVRNLPREMSRRKKMEDKLLEREMKKDKSSRSIGQSFRSAVSPQSAPGTPEVQTPQHMSPEDAPLTDPNICVVPIQVTRRATQMDMHSSPTSHANELTVPTQGGRRGRSTEPRTRGRDDQERDPSCVSEAASACSNRSGAFASRAERAAFFIQLKKEKSEQLASSPFAANGEVKSPAFGISRSPSPNPSGKSWRDQDASWRSPRGDASVTPPQTPPSSPNPVGNDTTVYITMKADNFFPENKVQAAKLAEEDRKWLEERKAADEKKKMGRTDTESSLLGDAPSGNPPLPPHSFPTGDLAKGAFPGATKYTARSQSPEPSRTASTRGRTLTKSDTGSSLLGAPPTPPNNRTFVKQDSILGAGDAAMMKNDSVRSFSKGTSSSRPQSLEPCARRVDFSKVDVERFSREPSLEPSGFDGFESLGRERRSRSQSRDPARDRDPSKVRAGRSLSAARNATPMIPSMQMAGAAFRADGSLDPAARMRSLSRGPGNRSASRGPVGREQSLGPVPRNLSVLSASRDPSMDARVTSFPRPKGGAMSFKKNKTDEQQQQEDRDVMATALHLEKCLLEVQNNSEPNSAQVSAFPSPTSAMNKMLSGKAGFGDGHSNSNFQMPGTRQGVLEPGANGDLARILSKDTLGVPGQSQTRERSVGRGAPNQALGPASAGVGFSRARKASPSPSRSAVSETSAAN